MTVMHQPTQDLERAVRGVEDAAALRGFLAPDAAAAIWNRSLPDGVLDWVASLDPARLPRGRVILHRSNVAAAVRELCDMAALPAGAQRDWFETDIADLAHIFADLVKTRYLRLRLDVVTTNACRKFHLDAITARLVCTYRGTGTQYGLADRGQDPARIFTVPTGAPILLRGSLWPPEPPSGLLHRSPPIEGTGETRLVLVLDPVTDPQDEL